MKIMCDIDGVLADFIRGFASAARQFIDPTVPAHTDATVPFWDVQRIMPPPVAQATWDYVNASETFWQGLPPLLSAHESQRLRELCECEQVYFVTSRRGVRVKQQTEQWLRSQLAIDRPTVLVTARKGEIARALGADFALDDKAGNAVYTAYESPSTISCLIDRPYNAFDHDVLGNRVRRVRTVTEFLNLVTGLGPTGV